MKVRRLAVTVLGVLAVLLLGSASAWAHHTPAPAPSLKPGETATVRSTGCHDVTNGVGSRIGQVCDPTSYTINPAPAPAPTSVQVTAASPLPVREVSPAPAATADPGLGCGSADDPCVTDWSPNTVAAVGVPALGLLLVGGVRIAQGFRR